MSQGVTMAVSVVTFIVYGLIFFVGVPVALFMLFRRAPKWLHNAKANAAARARQTQDRAAAEAAFRAKYAAWQTFESPVDRSYLAIDFDGKRVCIGQVCAVREYPFSALKGTDLLLDGGSTLTTRLDRPYRVGIDDRGLLRAIESPSSTVKLIGEIILRVTVDDPQTPVYRVTFMKADGAGVDPGDPSIRQIAGVADRFHALLSNAHDQGQGAPQSDAADAIKRLWELKQAGALTEDEFEAQKAKLLAAT